MDAKPTAPQALEIDHVTYEVVRHRLTAIVAQQSIVLKNVSGSPLVTDANDCNTGIYLPDGEIVTLGPHILHHSGSMEVVVENIIRDCEVDPGIRDGDSFVTNDPYKGALHMPDITMLAPVFCSGDRVAWIGSCAHVLDVGGMTPSSWCPDATQIYQEGLIIPPTKLINDGKIRSDVWNLILSASRLPASLGLDLKAMIASNNHAKRGLLRLIDRYGVEVVTTVMRRIIDDTEKQVRKRLASLPDGTFRARNYFDHDGHESRIARVEVAMSKQGDSLTFDYSASSEQTNGFFNCALSGLRGGIMSALLPVLCHDIPWNSGVMRAVEVIAPEGCVVNARHPAPCGAATIGGAWMVENTAGAALAQLVSVDEKLRKEAMAGTCGSISIFHIAGLNQYREGFGGALTEVLAGGGGATATANGLDYAGPHNILTYQVTNVEGDEAAFPLLYLSRFASADGGGAGRLRGGLSSGSAFTLHDADFLHGVLAAHSMSMPSTFGLHGGHPGSCHHISIVRGSNVWERMRSAKGPVRAADLRGQIVNYSSSPGEVVLTPNDVVDWTFHGGGGWGDPLDAEPASIAADVTDGRVTTQTASQIYGVIIREGTLDKAATEARRKSLRAARRTWKCEATFAGKSRAAPVAEALRVGDHLVLFRAAGGERVLGCDCGHVLSPANENWKQYAGRSTLHAEDLGPKVRLHEDLVADAYACPGCGALLTIEVRWKIDAPLQDIHFGYLAPNETATRGLS